MLYSSDKMINHFILSAQLDVCQAMFQNKRFSGNIDSLMIQININDAEFLNLMLYSMYHEFFQFKDEVFTNISVRCSFLTGKYIMPR